MGKSVYPQITIKAFTKKRLELASKSGNKPNKKLIMDTIADVLKKRGLILANGTFLLAEDEELFEQERIEEQKTHGNSGTNALLSADSKIWLQELSEKSGIPMWRLVDHGLRVAIKYGCLRGKNKGIREAVKRQSSRADKLNSEIQLGKIDFEARASQEPENTIIGLEEGPRVVALSRRKGKERKIKLMLEEISDYRLSIRFILKHLYHADSFNYKEIDAFRERVLLNRNPVPVDFIRSKEPRSTINENSYGSISERKRLYSLLSSGVRIGLNRLGERGNAQKVMKWIVPDCFKWLDLIVEINRLSYKEIKEWNFSIKEWYEYIGLPLPSEYEYVRHDRIETRQQLDRIGIAEALDLKIKKVLEMLDFLEYAYVNFEELDAEDRAYLKL